jgi:hypothetical protein
MDLLGTIPERARRRHGLNSLSDINPEIVVGLRGLKQAVWFVDSNRIGSTGDGRSWDGAFLTLAAAIAAAGVDDVIMVAPLHAENVTAAAGIAISKAGVSILGLGNGRRAPRFTFTTSTAAQITVAGAGVKIANISFDMTGVDALVAGLSLLAADISLEGCEFELADAAGQAAIGVLTDDACDRLRIVGCHFHGAGDTTAQVAISMVGGDDWVIANNIFAGYFGTAGAIAHATTASVNGQIINNTFINRTADGNNKAIVLEANSVVLIANNRIAIIDSSGPAPITAAAGFVGGNYSASAAGVTAGTLI